MNLSRAFDTSEHGIILGKFCYYGINGISPIWFWSYLSNRNQDVEIKNEKSSCLDIKAWGPKGAIRGLLLFLIYMNDIPSGSQSFRVILYADDTNSFSTMEYSTPIRTSKEGELLNHEFFLVNERLEISRLSLKMGKNNIHDFSYTAIWHHRSNPDPAWFLLQDVHAYQNLYLHWGWQTLIK